jgi:endonuclease/exonuclease/phosphatase family metal-dependent hydrolase
MRLLVRSWNVFHGNAHPPRRTSFLRRMVELATRDGPDVVCLQELPIWALARLQRWSGMEAHRAIARPPVPLGPVPGWLTRLHQGRFRSALTGQANAILVAGSLAAEDAGRKRISDARRERRIVHAVRIPGPPAVVVANLHASNEFRDPAVPRAEAARAAAFAEAAASGAAAVVLAGDFNVRDPQLHGYSAPTEGLDHVLVRGATVVEVAVWPLERRTRDGVVLSDHAPVDCTLEVGGA